MKRLTSVYRWLFHKYFKLKWSKTHVYIILITVVVYVSLYYSVELGN